YAPPPPTPMLGLGAACPQPASPLPLRLQIVRFLAVLSNVKAFHLVVLADAEAGDPIGYFENHHRADKRKAPREKHADQLIAHLSPMAVARAHRLALSKNRIDDRLRENAGEQGAGGAAGTVDAEGVQRVIIPEQRLHLRYHQVADDAGD